MGAVGGLLGVAGGAGGSGYGGPSAGSVVNPTELANAGQGANNALASQLAFTNAVAPGGAAGLAAQQNVLGQFGQGAAGLGPNPALAQLNQTTAANTANQAALMAGQRGANQNAGLIARQAAQQGAANQQQAAGQTATQQAQQQIAYQQALAGQANSMVGQQAAAQQAQTQAAENQQNFLTSAAAGLQQSVNAGNAALTGQTMSGQQSMYGGGANIAGSMLGSGGGKAAAAAAGGGKVEELPKMADGGMNFLPYTSSYNGPAVQSLNVIDPTQSSMYKGMSNFGKALASRQQAQSPINNIPTASDASQAPSDPGEMTAAPNDMFAEGGKIPALVSPGERYLPPKEVKAVAEGKKDPMKAGEHIPGKPKVGGSKNSYANDTVKKTLDEGGIVLPRSVTQAKHPHWEAHKFISAIMAKNGGKLK